MMTSHKCDVICKQTNRLDRLPEQFSLNRSSGGRCWLARPQGWWFSVSMRTHEPVSSSALRCLLVGHPLALWWYQEGRSVWNPTLQRKWKQYFISIWIQIMQTNEMLELTMRGTYREFDRLVNDSLVHSCQCVCSVLDFASHFFRRVKPFSRKMQELNVILRKNN